MWLICLSWWSNRLLTTCNQTLTFSIKVIEYFMFTALVIKINLIYYWRGSIIFNVKEKQKLITFINSNSHIIYSFFVRFNLTHGVWQHTFINIYTLNWFMVHCCKTHTITLFSTFPVQTRSKKPVSVLVSAKGIFLIKPHSQC